MPVETVINARVPVKVWTDSIEPQAVAQLKNTASLPFVFHHVVAMPDVHLGIGATVGSVVATKGAVCPAAVGVDIGCGMMARKTAIPAERLGADALKKLRQSIERDSSRKRSRSLRGSRGPGIGAARTRPRIR
jgi:tRNA-splicing ligase RtcB